MFFYIQLRYVSLSWPKYPNYNQSKTDKAAWKKEKAIFMQQAIKKEHKVNQNSVFCF